MHGQQPEKIGLLTAVAVGLNAMIGIGIISVATTLAKNAGPIGVFSYVLSTVVVLAIGLALGFIARKYPSTSWNYDHPARFAGHAVGMFSVSTYLCAVIIAMGFLVQKVGEYAYQLAPCASPEVLSVLILAVLTILVLAGAEISSVGQLIILGSVLTSLLVTTITCWIHVNPELLYPFMPHGLSALFFASPSALFGFLGFESIASLYSIVKDPVRTVPRATVFSIVIVGILYILFTGGILFSIAPQFFYDNPTLDVLMTRAFPQMAWASKIVLVGVIFGIVGTLHSMIWSLSTLLNDVLGKIRSAHLIAFFKKASWGSAHSALCIASCMLAVALLVRGEALVNMTIFFIIPSFIFSFAGLLFDRDEWASGRNVVTIIALLGCGVMMYFATQMLIVSCMQIL